MIHPRARVLAAAAAVLTLLAIGLGLGRTPPRSWSDILIAAAALVGLVAAGWHLYRTRNQSLGDHSWTDEAPDPSLDADDSPEEGLTGPDDSPEEGLTGPDDAAASGSVSADRPGVESASTGPEGATATIPGSLAPERTPEAQSLSGTELAGRTTEAANAAREAESLAAGIEVVRPVLRSTQCRVLQADGYSRARAEQLLAAGDWTDDPVAAAVVDPGVALPEQSLRERVRAWLHPDRVLRSYTRRTTAEITDLAAARLPSIPGQDAPRLVPTSPTPVERLTRSVDGALQEAEDPFVAAAERQVDPSETDVREIHERLGLVEGEQ